ncbi:MAG: accessory factor UbiK family protein [Alphaproteobacteria bacterium]|nr:accessory factor UbiK family protein [Alphaproteobacteria bacterium]
MSAGRDCARHNIAFGADVVLETASGHHTSGMKQRSDLTAIVRERPMRGRSRFISDMAQMANGAASALGGLREEIDNIVKQRTERSLNARGLVTREEFDALRTRHDAVAARLAALESRLAEQASSPKKAARKVAKKATKSAGTRASAAKKS